MPGEELHDEGAAAGARSGRHAAPRKPLLTRLHVPAGKAIAIAAMPSAVLMGMGLTPQLAVAKPKPPESPFRDGPCVTAPDKVEGKDAKSKDKAEDKKDGKATAEPSAKPSASPSGTDEGKTSEPTADPKTDEPSDSATPSPSASPEEEKKDGGLLGGVGDALGGLLGGGEDSSEEESTASPSPSPSESSSEDTASKDATSDETKAEDSGSATDKVTKPVQDTLDGVTNHGDGGKTVNDTVHGAVGTVDNVLPGGGLDGTDANGKKGYPCVVENKQKGKDEQTPVTLPDDPWHLESSALTLRGLDYEGVVNVTTQNGSTKQALKFTADSVDIGDLHQIVDDPTSGKKYHVQARKGSTSTIRGGKVTMYTEKLQGNLFGLIPVTFDPEHPPPLNTPFAYFTKVKIDQAGQFGGNLHVPGLHQFMTD
ncbi:hypothetical protein [Streptomyces sp. NPDC053542]|uniref:hypothetical protein n=1 Tax=Streptomyces sp. NPDC053542 TaxID=3365710 RepID=UPI0037D2A68C